ncbi:MAG: MYXO-CTERM sorting domain-containing protein [Sandaracinaceae bacterium]
MTSRFAIVFLTLSAICATARAQVECPPDAVGCHVEDVDFEHRDALFDDVMLDSGWVPAGSPLQVRFALMLGGSTQVNMGGTSVTSWPPPLSEVVLGRAGTGRLAINYGIEIIARIRFDVTVAGTRYTWEGDIPIPGGIPPDLRMADESTFDPFLLPPSETVAMVMDETGAIPVINTDITDSLIPIPGIGGGFLLTATGSLGAAYVTNRIVVDDAVDAITTEGGSVVVRAGPDEPELGAAKDVRITPEGTISYDGAIILAPSLYIEVAGRRFELPIAEVPIPIADFDSNTDFNTAEVHVPLPDIRVDPTSLDFEPTAVGASSQVLLTVHNEGEAPLVVEVRDPAAPFAVTEHALTIPPSSSARLAVDFAPFIDGDRSAVLFLASNDPDEPLVTIPLSGSGFGEATLDGGVASDAGPSGPPTAGGCACRASRAPHPGGALWLVGLLGLGLSAARRRRP